MSRLDELILELCPNGVEYKTLDDLFVLKNGYTPSKKNDEYWHNGTVPWFRLEDIRTNGRVLSDAKQHVTSKAVKGSLFPANSIIVSTTATIGEHALIESPFLINQQLTCVSVKEQFKAQINIKFVFYYFEILKEDLKRIASQSGNMPIVSLAKMKQLLMPLPPLEVQQEIVRLLDNFTAKTAKLQAELNKEYEARKIQEQYYFKQIFSMYNAPIVKLGDIGRVKMCKRIFKAQTSSQGEIPFFKIGTFGKSADAFISKELYEEYIQKYSHPSKGDILISCAGTIGRTVVYDGNPAYFQDSNIVWLEHDNSQITNEYLRYVYKTNPWEISTGGTISRLYNDGIINAQIHLPTIEQQCKIVKMLDNFEKICEELQSKISSELESRQKQYEFYRDKLLTFKELS